MTIYQFKVTLVGIHPSIWRRFRVNSDISLKDLHDIIQIVMGWDNYHLYQFGIDYESYGGPDRIDGQSARGSTLSDLMPRVGYRFGYEYDFGDQWLHELEFEKVLTSTSKLLPVCTAGRRACPPEDIGGVWGYEDMVKGMKQGRGRRYNEWRRRLGERFDPEAFDKAGVNEMLAEWRGRNAPAPEVTEQQPQPLLPGLSCEMCDKPIAAKLDAGKPRLYCSPACKQAAYRKSKGARVETRQGGRSLGNVQVCSDGVSICALQGCENPAAPGKRGRWKMYCCDAHKQRAKRWRLKEATRRQFGPTPTEPAPEHRLQTLPTEPESPQADQPRPLLYFRKGRGVVHLAVSRNVTICGRDTVGMGELEETGGLKVCQYCQRVKDRGTWWHNWRELFGDGTDG